MTRQELFNELAPRACVGTSVADVVLDEVLSLRQQLAAALAACEAIKSDVHRCHKMLLTEPDAGRAAFKAEAILDETMLIQPDASALRAHDNALIERCVEALLTIANDDAGNPYKQALRIGVEAIRELKGK